MSKSSLLQYHQQHLIHSFQSLSVQPNSYLPYPTLIPLLSRYPSHTLRSFESCQHASRYRSPRRLCLRRERSEHDFHRYRCHFCRYPYNSLQPSTITATTLATTAIPSSDPSATNVFDSPADVTAALSSASVIAAATSSAAVDKRAATTCVPQPAGINYAVQPDTAAGWVADLNLAASASAANKALPTDYVSSFVALNASNSADNYMGFTLMTSYDVTGCATKCNAISGCNSFNIYFERDPSVNPDDSSCSDPPSTVQVKVTFSPPLSLSEPIANPSKVCLLGWCRDLREFYPHSSRRTN
jgi:hypothetical protein